MTQPAGTLALDSQRRQARIAPGVGTVLLFCLAHFFIDLYSGALGIFQPELVRKLGLSLTQAGILGGVLVFSSSVTQPLYGYLSDRFRSRAFSALSPAVAGIFITGLGLATSFPAALLLVLLGGAGVSAFHPQGSSWATARVATHRSFWMAVFISSGTLGIALSPTIFSRLIGEFGFERVTIAAIPGIAVSVIMFALVRAPEAKHAAAAMDWRPLLAVWKPLTLLYFAVFFRSAVQVTFTQFLALYLHRERGMELGQAALVLTLYLTAGALGGIVGGRLADRFGAKLIITWSFALSVPFMAYFFLFPGWTGHLALAVGGLLLLFTIPVNVLAAQNLAPNSAGTVSALMMGFAWGMAGLVFIPWTGWLSDHTSLHTALFSLLIWPVIGFFLSRHLPENLDQ